MVRVAATEDDDDEAWLLYCYSADVWTVAAAVNRKWCSSLTEPDMHTKQTQSSLLHVQYPCQSDTKATAATSEPTDQSSD